MAQTQDKMNYPYIEILLIEIIGLPAGWRTIREAAKLSNNGRNGNRYGKWGRA
jgi:hypothetical protein